MNITKKCSTHNTTAKKNRPLDYIVIHYTAGVSSKPGSAANTAAYFARPDARQASADFILDDSYIIQYNPDIKNRYCWHCGGGKQGNSGAAYYGKCLNSNSIGIEICSTNRTGKVTNANDRNWYFSDAVLKNAEDLVNYLMKTYNIPPSNVIRHFDVTGKSCPGVPGWNSYTKDESRWKDFKRFLQNGANSDGYIVEVNSPDGTLNLREEPNSKSKIVQVLKNGNRVKIVGRHGDWLQTNWNRWLYAKYVKVV